jgi:hypothetical protein
MKEWVGEDEGQYMVAIRRRQPLCNFVHKALPALKFNIFPVTYHNLIIIRPRRSGPHSSTQWHWTQVFQRGWRKEKIRSCSNMGDLVYLSALRWCTKPLSKYSSHFSYSPPQGFLYPAQLTAGVLTKQLRMVNYRTFSPILLQFR